MCFGCSKEPSHRDGSFEYPQHMFWVRNKEISFPIHTLILRPDVLVSVVIHVSSRRTSSATSSEKFGNAILDALADMKKLLD